MTSLDRSIVALGLVLSTVVAAARAANAGHAAAVAHPTFGVAFDPPQGWVEQMKEKAETVGLWVHPQATPADPKAIVTVEAAKPVLDSAEKTAAGLAQNFKGSVLKQTTLLDGEKAWHVRSEQKAAALHPVEAVVAMHDGYIYLIMGGVTGSNTCRNEVERIRSTWKWTKWEPPSKHLELRKEPLTALGGNVVINVPQTMRRNTNDDPDHVLDLSIPNLHRNAPDFLLYAQLVPRNPNQSFAELKKGFVEGLGQKLKLDPPPAWRRRARAKGTPDSGTTPVLDIDATTIGQKGRAYIVFALIELDASRAVLINFTLSAESEQERKAYVPVIDQIVDSVRPANNSAAK